MEYYTPCILLVEDDDIVRTINYTILHDLGYKVITAINGRQAIEQVSKCNLVLLDIGLPDIDGIKVCKKIRKFAAAKYIPIIALTAYGKEIEKECRDAGFDDFAVKPLLADELSKLLEKEYLSINKIN